MTSKETETRNIEDWEVTLSGKKTRKSSIQNDVDVNRANTVYNDTNEDPIEFEPDPSITDEIKILTQNNDIVDFSKYDHSLEIFALSGNDKILGTKYGDIFHGQEGNDYLYGMGGNDYFYETINNNSEKDYIYGGEGIDTIDYSQNEQGLIANLVNNTVEGSEGDSIDRVYDIENVTGSNYNDIIEGNSANNVLIGLEGDDSIYGNGGDDYIKGGAGNNTLNGGDGYDTLDYSHSDIGVGANLTYLNRLVDTTFYPSSSVQHGYNSEEYIDEIYSGYILTDFEKFIGSSYDDVIAASYGSMDIVSADGDDNVSIKFFGSYPTNGDADYNLYNVDLGNGNDYFTANIFEGEFDDDFTGDGDSNNIDQTPENLNFNYEINVSGGAGNDTFIIANFKVADLTLTIDGGEGNDYVEFKPSGDHDAYVDLGNGDDQFKADKGNHTIYGGSGNDVIDGGDGDNIIYGGSGNDDIGSGEGDDTIFTGDGNNNVFSIGGNNIIYGGSGNDDIGSGDGEDIIYSGDGNNFVFSGYGNDIIYGGDNDDYLSGFYGDDIIYSGDGADYIVGGQGSDHIYVAGGSIGNGNYNEVSGDSTSVPEWNYADVFHFEANSTSLIRDFDDNLDKINLSSLGIGYDDLSITTSDIVTSNGIQTRTTIKYEAENVEIWMTTPDEVIDVTDFIF